MIASVSKKLSFNLIGRQPHTLKAVYDITEYLYYDNVPYKITNNKQSFFHASSTISNKTILLNTCDVATYESLTNLHNKAYSASDGHLDICNVLVFPHIHGTRDRHIHTCNNMLLGMYYLDEGYDKKRNYVRCILEFMRTRK
jgi:hypothetical protein